MSDFLSKNDVVGHRIVTVHMKGEVRYDDLIHTQTYLTLEKGLRFFLPLGFNKFFRGAVDLTGYVEGDKTLPILNSPIKRVHLRIDKMMTLQMKFSSSSSQSCACTTSIWLPKEFPRAYFECLA